MYLILDTRTTSYIVARSQAATEAKINSCMDFEAGIAEI